MYGYVRRREIIIIIQGQTGEGRRKEYEKVGRERRKEKQYPTNARSNHEGDETRDGQCVSPKIKLPGPY